MILYTTPQIKYITIIIVRRGIKNTWWLSTKEQTITKENERDEV